MHALEDRDRAAWDDFLLAYSQGNIDDTSRSEHIPNLDRYLQELGGWLTAPLRLDEPDRMKAFERYSEDILQAYKDAGSDLKLDGYTRLAAALCDTPISLLNLLDSNTQWVISESGLGQWRNKVLPRSHTFCAHTILRTTRDVFVVTDAKNDWRFAKMPMVCGEPFVQYYMGAPLTTSDGQNIGALCVLDTTSDRPCPTEKQKAGLIDLADTIMRELDLRADRLVARKAKEIFLSSISHELRSPLHGLMAYTELMIDDGHLTPFQELCSKTIQNCGKTLCDVIDQVLFISNGHGEGEKLEQVDLPGFLEEVVDATWAGKSKSKTKIPDFEVTIDVDMTHIRHPFKINRGEIGRIIMNIFGNAIKYTEKGFLSVKLYAGSPAFHENGRRLQHVTMVFEDSGKGIAQEFLPKLFLPFVQQDHLCEGFGLGMSLVKQLVDKNNGIIEVESEVDVGTKITVTLLLETVKISDADRKQLVTNSSDCLKGVKFFVYDKTDETLQKSHMIKTCTRTFAMQHTSLSEADVVLLLHGDLLDEVRKENQDKAILVFASGDIMNPQSTDHLRPPVGPAKLSRALKMAITLQEQRMYQARRSSIVHLDPVSPPTSCAIKDMNPLERPLSVVPEISQIELELGKVDSNKSGSGESTMFSSATSSSTQQHDLEAFKFGRPKTTPATSLSRESTASTKANEDENVAKKPYCLCVDDNSVNLQIMSALLSKLDVPFDTAENGQQAYAAITKPDRRFDIIFMDVRMPVMDGIEATKLIREYETANDLPCARIVALTGCGQQEEHAACEAGANYFLKKPVSMKELTFFVGQFGPSTLV